MIRRRFLKTTLTATAGAALGRGSVSAAPAFDLVIRGGTVLTTNGAWLICGNYLNSRLDGVVVKGKGKLSAALSSQHFK